MSAATKAKSRKKPSSSATSRARKKPSGSTSKKKSPARKPSSTKRKPANKAKKKRSTSQVLGEALAGHGADLAGIALLVLAFISALGIWAQVAGPVGVAIDSAARIVAGVAAVAVPIVLAVAGVILIIGRNVEVVTRVLIGVALILLGVIGLVHLATGTAALDSGWQEVADGGGYAGALVAVPLAAALGAAAAVVVCIALVVAGALVATGTRLRALAPQLKKLADVAGIVEPVTDVSARDTADAADVSPVETHLYDHEADTAAADECSTSTAAPATEPRKPKAAMVSKARKKPEQLPLSSPPLPDAETYDLPDMKKILAVGTKSHVDKSAVTDRGAVIEETLREFNVGATLTRLIVGPTVTRYEVELEQGVKVNKLINLAPDLQYALATPDVRLIAPIPGRSAIGLEVPNAERRTVTVGDILLSPEAEKDHNPLAVALGRDISGKAMLVDVTAMPHVLISGQTGSGKSSCINSILTSILCRTRPSEVRLILIDPKRVELGRFDGVPHLLGPVVTDPKKASNALAWAVDEMEVRYQRLADAGARDILSFNAAVDRGEIKDANGDVVERLPYIVLVVDELADLMTVRRREVEDSIQRIAQMARAVGIHLVVATQRPSVDVITGVIRSNIPTRMAFKTRTLVESRVILDQQGAEKLVGKGDLLYLAGSAGTTERVQNCFVTEREVSKVVDHWRAEVRRVGTPELPAGAAGADTASAAMTAAGNSGVPGAGGPDSGLPASAEISAAGAVPAAAASRAPSAGAVSEAPADPADIFDREPAGADLGDELFGQAMELVVQSQLGSTSMLQRKLRVGFARAGRIMDLLEENGIVGPSEGSKARKVLVAEADLDAMKASLGL